jgi:hypothetical protein
MRRTSGQSIAIQASGIIGSALLDVNPGMTDGASIIDAKASSDTMVQ